MLPTFLRLRLGSAFQRGPWHLGRWSRPIGIIAVTWVVFITILFMLPTAYPITWNTFNYTVIAVVAVLGFAAIYWAGLRPQVVHRSQGAGLGRGTGRDRELNWSSLA